MGLWRPGNGEGIVRIAESFAEDADADSYSRWIAGVIFAAVIVAFGLAHFAAAAGWPPVRWMFQFWGVRDSEVIIGIGGFLLSVALFVHAHYFWTPSERWHALGHVGKILAALIIAALLLVAVVGGFVGWFAVPRLGNFRRW